MDSQTYYQNAIKFAALQHKEQTIPGTQLPYMVHLSNVAMEILIAAAHSPGFDLSFAIQVALLHDILEDTTTTFDQLAEEFGPEVATAVAALTKTDTLPKSVRMADSLSRIKALRHEVWAVKLADRITNLQAPPAHWTASKKADYLQEANVIWETLQAGNAYLANRLHNKIQAYEIYLHQR